MSLSANKESSSVPVIRRLTQILC